MSPKRESAILLAARIALVLSILALAALPLGAVVTDLDADPRFARDYVAIDAYDVTLGPSVYHTLTGLDPVQRRRMTSLFHRLGDDGRTVLVSSHVLDEVARLGSRVLVIAQGRLAATGDYRDLRELMDDRPHRIRITASDARRLATRLVADGLVVGLSLDGDERWVHPIEFGFRIRPDVAPTIEGGTVVVADGDQLVGLGVDDGDERDRKSVV